jgi:iron complex outermembrane receptor protein
MKKMMNVRSTKYRGQLLATASVFVLLTASANCAEAGGNESGRPPLWIDLGWQFERGGGGQELFAPAFVGSIVSAGFTSPLKVENVLPWSYGADGKISYQPSGSDWLFSASVRYGRARGRHTIHEQTAGAPRTEHFGSYYQMLTPGVKRFAQTKAENAETHTIIDFQAGKDIGMGLFGQGSVSVLSAGVRYAQIKFGSHSEINADPDKYLATNLLYGAFNHLYAATNDETRDFKGLGPTLSWSGSTPLAGNLQDGAIVLDWGVNAGLLFGKQKATGQHQSGFDYYKTAPSVGKYQSHSHPPAIPHDRSRSVTVPNLGGFAGLSLDWSNAKISLGYRADVFFGAVDGGIDTRKSENRGFYGPFASISIGVGGSSN